MSAIQMREQFERQVTIPDGVYWDSDAQQYEHSSGNDDVAEAYHNKFVGFQVALQSLEGDQVVARVHHNDEHSEPVRAVLNSIGRTLPDHAPLYTTPQPPAVPDDVKLKYQSEAVEEFAQMIWEEILKNYTNIKVLPLTMSKKWIDSRKAMLTAAQQGGNS